jgi:4a-hydroxytetrahydrobiopterin dehydratase
VVAPITPDEFAAADGVGDWRVLPSGVACAYFRTGSFAAGVELLNVIGRLADEANHHPDVDLRYPGMTVRLLTHEVSALTHRDIALARQISAAAAEAGIAADPSAVADLTA